MNLTFMRTLKMPLILAGLILATAVSHAAVYYYTSTTSGTTMTDGAGTWSAASGNTFDNWLLNNAGTAGVWANNNDAVFGATNNGAAGAITLASTPVVNNLTFQPVQSGYYVFNSSDLRLGSSSGTIATITVLPGVTADIGNNGGSSTFLAQGAGNNGVILEGGGTLILSYKGHSTYSGKTWITNNTTVMIFSNCAFATSSALVLGSGTLATYTNVNTIGVTNSQSTSLAGNFTLGFENGAVLSKTLGFAGAWTLAGGSWTITNNATTNYINAAIGDGGSGLGLGVASINGGELVLGNAGNETYTGPTTISGTLALANGCNLSSASSVVLGAGGTLDVSAQTSWSPGSTATPALTASGTATAATIKGGTTVALGALPVTLNYDGTDDTMLTISQGALTMNGNIITINTNSAGNGATLAHGTHNIIAVTGGSITASSLPTISAASTALAQGDSATVSLTGGTPNYVQITVQGSTVPTLTAPTKSSITATSATLGATVTGNGAASVTSYGIAWSTSPNPTIANNVVSAGSSPTLNSPYTVSVTGLPASTTIYYCGYATNIDGVGYSAIDSFTTLPVTPTVQASGAAFSNVQGGSATLSWTPGNGSSSIVLISQGSAVSSSPVNLTTYTGNVNFGSGTQIGSGNYVAYVGSGSSVTLTALTPGDAYYAAVYTFNGSAGTQQYLTTTPALSQTATPAHPVTYYTGAAVSDPTQTGSWWTGTNGTGANPSNFTGGDTFIIQSGNLSGMGAAWAVNATTAGTAATLQINSGGELLITNTASGFTLSLGGNFAQNGTFATPGVNNACTLDFTSSGVWTGSGSLTNGNNTKISVTVDSAATLDISGLSTSITMDSHSDTTGFTVNGSIITGNTVINGSSSFGNAGKNSFTLGASGTLLTANAAGVPAIFTNFNTGKVNLPVTANYTFNGPAAQVTGTSTTNATMPATVNNLVISNTAGVSLSQPTTVSGLLTVNNNSLLDLNQNVLTVSSPPTLNGTLKMEVTKTGSSFSGSELVLTAGTLGYGGSLTMTENGSALAGNDKIYLFNAPAYGGSFVSSNLPALPAGLSWSTAGLTVDGSVLVSSGGPSGPATITNSISGGTLSLTWPSGQSWRLVGQTNNVSTGLNPNSSAWGTVTAASDGSYSAPVDPHQPTVFYRLVYP